MHKIEPKIYMLKCDKNINFQEIAKNAFLTQDFNFTQTLIEKAKLR